MHYAIVKCERVQVEWKYRATQKDDYWEKTCYRNLNNLMNNNDFGVYTWEELKRRESCWKSSLERQRHLSKRHIKNGQCILWEGEVNQELLRVTDNLYIPSIEKYLEIIKLEVNPNGEVIYYVSYEKEFYDTLEKSRLRVIEEWIEKEYRDVEKFEDLKKYKDETIEGMKEYENYLNYKENKINGNYTKGFTDKECAVQLTSSYENECDKRWEKTVVGFGIGFIMFICLMLFITIMLNQ